MSLLGKNNTYQDASLKAEERARKRLEAKSADIDIARAELALKRALVRKGLKA